MGCLLALGSLAWIVGSARAWTDAQVHEVDAEVALDAKGGADVALSLVLEVRDGWLELLELSGFDEALRLASGEGAALLVTDAGERIVPVASAQGGTITLRFATARAPKRGTHRVVLRYHSDVLPHASPGADVTRVSYRLPGWESGLRRASVRFRAAQPLRAVADPSVAQTVRSGRASEDGSARFERVHLPRRTPWEVAVEMSAPARPRILAPAPSEATAARVLAPRFAASAVLALLMAMLARHRGRRRAGRAGIALGPERATPYVLASLATGAAVLVQPHALALALGLLLLAPLWLALGLRRGARVVARGPLQPVSGDVLARAARAARGRWLGTPGELDASTLAGGLGLALALVLVLHAPDAFTLAGDPFGLALLCAAPSWFLGARVRFPRGFDERLHALATAARASTLRRCALQLVSAVDEAGALVCPRLRVLPAEPIEGLVRIDVLADTRRDAPPLVLSVTVQSGSPCQRWLAQALPGARPERRGSAKRLAFVQPVDALDAPVDALLATLAQRQREDARTPQDHARAA